MLPGRETCCRQHMCLRQHVARQQVARSGNMNFVDDNQQHVEGNMLPSKKKHSAYDFVTYLMNMLSLLPLRHGNSRRSTYCACALSVGIINRPGDLDL